ncbi:hypothetical protein [Pseudomonas sp. NFACC05-1]|uniref:hypothetical protein n=1 Tax=Pseudomonas sp. NFACC05-1 TaxID=1566241 RepID=UPI0008712666|nr:hypothetical protein [Pseudomonas sp. NFACC05-1]SCW91815.1 hypothetical protein SAMN03159424_04373 [Pseudomonas sp. NFACC05-1]
MPAPDLTPQTPGEPLATMSPIAPASGNPDANESSTATAQPPLYVAKHSAGGRWHVVTNDAQATRVGDFVGDKVSIIAEVERMNAGGEPLVLDAQRNGDREALETPKPAAAGAVDPTTLKQAVMTPDGWLCPEPKVKE